MPCSICKKPGHNRRTCALLDSSKSRVKKRELKKRDPKKVKGIKLKPISKPPAPPPLECAICLENITKVNKVITHCNHVFHFDCLVKNSAGPNGNCCPICRSKLPVAPVIPSPVLRRPAFVRVNRLPGRPSPTRFRQNRRYIVPT